MFGWASSMKREVRFVFSCFLLPVFFPYFYGNFRNCLFLGNIDNFLTERKRKTLK